MRPTPDTNLAGFVIAGRDYNWVPADARIVVDAVIVSSVQVPKPVAVRYDWSLSAFGNLSNKREPPGFPLPYGRSPLRRRLEDSRACR